MNRILALWAHPRSLSTALERVFIERGDFAVLHEPFSAVYYHHEQRAEAVGARFQEQAADYDSVRDKILRTAEQRPLFFKDMCYHCHDHLVPDETFLKRVSHLFLIRDPRQAIASHYAKNSNVRCEEIGYEKQAGLFRRVRDLNGSSPPVVEAEGLQADPGGTLRRLCERLQLDHRGDALQWTPGHHPQWDAWRPWHQEVADSQGIHRASTDYEVTVDNNEQLAAFYHFHLPFYEEMKGSGAA